MFSGGEVGIWESFRPLIHPFILGVFWKIGVNVILIGKILDLTFSLLSIYLVYKISEKIYTKEAGLFASALFSFTSVFIIFTGLVLTEPLALLFGLLGIYFFLKPSKKIYLYLTGLFLGLSFLTKFPQGALFLGTIMVILIYREELKAKVNYAFWVCVGFLTLIIPYLLLNYFLYHNPFTPFLFGSEIMTTSTWAYGSGWTYYLINFFGKNPLYLLIFPAAYLWVRSKKWKNKQESLMVIIILIFMAYFLYLPRKEVRYMIFALPFLAIVIGGFIAQQYYNILNSSKKLIKKKAFLTLFVLLLLLPLPTSLHIERMPTFEKEISQVISERGINETILTSDPSFVSFLDLPVITLGGMEFAPKTYFQQKGKYQLLFINDCDLDCSPDDRICTLNRNQLLKEVYTENEVYHQTLFKNCTYSLLLPKNN
ncbi:MAG: glycosyltransferase family 39 protein [Candidatus Woesearchaeota archaeon]